MTICKSTGTNDNEHEFEVFITNELYLDFYTSGSVTVSYFTVTQLDSMNIHYDVLLRIP